MDANNRYFIDDAKRKAYTYNKENMPKSLDGKREVTFEEQAFAVQVQGFAQIYTGALAHGFKSHPPHQ